MSPAYVKILEYAAWGFIGGLIGLMSKNRRLEMPRMVVHRERDGRTSKWLDVGFLSSPFLGSALAIYFDTRPENALAWGMVAGYAGSSVLTLLQERLLSAAGFKVGIPEPAPTNGVHS